MAVAVAVAVADVAVVAVVDFPCRCDAVLRWGVGSTGVLHSSTFDAEAKRAAAAAAAAASEKLPGVAVVPSLPARWARPPPPFSSENELRLNV